MKASKYISKRILGYQKVFPNSIIQTYWIKKIMYLLSKQIFDVKPKKKKNIVGKSILVNVKKKERMWINVL